MKITGLTITKYLVDQEAGCVKCLIDEGEEMKAREIYLRFMAMFRFLNKIGYRHDELGLRCRVDAFSIQRIFAYRGVAL